MRGFTVDLVFHLENKGLRTRDLIDLTGKYAQYINRYLYNMRNYGLVEKEESYWKLTPPGKEFLSHLKMLNNTYNIQYGIYNKKDLRKKKESIKKDLRKLKSKTLKQVSIESFLRESDLDKTEVVVVEALVDHYNRTGSKFFAVESIFDLASRLHVDYQDLKEALRHLYEDHIVYKYHMSREGITKVGLYKAFVETLKASKKKS